MTWSPNAMIKAPLALESVGRNPTDRGKKGSKRSLLTDENGLPLSVVISGANTHDVELLAATLDGVIIGRPSEDSSKQNLCLDVGYVGETAKREIEEKDKNPDFKARRWVVEVCHSWYEMKKWIGVISACSCWPLLSSSFEKSSSKTSLILFTDKFLIFLRL